MASQAAPRDAALRDEPHDSQASKKPLRKKIKRALEQMTAEQMDAESRQICSRVLAQPLFEHARRLGLFMHCARLQEVNPEPLVQATLAADDEADLSPVAPFDIKEPKPHYKDGSPREDVLKTKDALDLLVMTGLSFDAQGHRLGRGGGYYDHFIQRLTQHAQENDHPRTLLVALAFEAQIVDEVPTTKHDMDMDIIITATRAYCCTPYGRAALSQSETLPGGLPDPGARVNNPIKMVF
eukprot:jgi/Astpho2/5092/Aster-06314